MAGHWRGILGVAALVCAGMLAPPATSQHQHDDNDVMEKYGTPVGRYPALDKAKPPARAQARRLWKRSTRAAKRRFPTYRSARRLGYVRYSRNLKRPLVFHLRHDEYDHDGARLDENRPESLAYWWPAKGKPVLIAYMYRMRPGSWPSYAKPLLGWHSHERGGILMTHVWMTRTLRTAIANCMPVAALEAANRRYRFAEPRQGYSLESHPCREFRDQPD
jgi:hypothetical protein